MGTNYFARFPVPLPEVLEPNCWVTRRTDDGPWIVVSTRDEAQRVAAPGVGMVAGYTTSSTRPATT